jgi:2-dehydropantoate 2-reductase
MALLCQAVPGVAVLGPGGVGGFLAAALARAGDPVTVIARESTVALIARSGISVSSVRLGEFTAHPAAAMELTEPVELLLVATKATGLEMALERIKAAPDLVVPLLNGRDHMDRLRERFGDEQVAAGTIRIEADRPQPGRVVHTSPFLRVDLAADHPAVNRRLQPVATQLERAEVPAQVGASEAQILWSKLVRLNALALTTSASGNPIGVIRSDPVWRELLVAAVTEAAAVAVADGAEVDPATPLAELDAAHAELGSSMQRDIVAGREPELDAIAGSVLRTAARHGLRCPTVERLAQQVADRAGIAPPRA